MVSFKKINQEKNLGWHHTIEDLNYYKNSLYRMLKGKRQYYYTLTFDFLPIYALHTYRFKE